MAFQGLAGRSIGAQPAPWTTPCPLHGGKFQSLIPCHVPVSPVDILEMLMSEPVAGLTSSSNSQGRASDLYLDGLCQCGGISVGMAVTGRASSMRSKAEVPRLLLAM